MLPRNVKWFAWLWIASFLLSFPELFLLPQQPVELARIGLSRPAYIKLIIAGLLLFTAILLPFFQLAVWKRRNWARWVLLLGFAVPLPLLFHSEMFQSDQLLMTIYDFAVTALEGVGFYFLFTGDARPWFRAEISK